MDSLYAQILQDYQKLYDIVKKHNQANKKKLTICPAIPGEDYMKVQGGLMFVGRAINSWCPLENSVVDDNIQERIARCEKCTLDWIEGENNWTHCKNNGCPYAQAEDKRDGKKNHTPFWQMIQYICKKNNILKDWYKQIVWSNLYKVSYVLGKNPTDFYQQQIELCNEILIKEIQFYKPRAIYFITEKNRKDLTVKGSRTWFCENYADTNIHFSKVYAYLRKENIDVFVLNRPEFQDKDTIYKIKQDLEGNVIES